MVDAGTLHLTGDESKWRAKSDEGKERWAYVPTLGLMDDTGTTHLRMASLADRAERISIYSPFKALREIREIRKGLDKCEPEYERLLKRCHELLGETVQGCNNMEGGWYQSWSTAMGLSALHRLQATYARADSTLDRKGAYALACFSLYLAIASMLISMAPFFMSI